LALEQKEQAEQARIDALKKAEDDAKKAADEAVENERKRVEEEQRKEREAQEKREADKAYKQKIYNEMMMPLCVILDEAKAKAVIKLIAENKVPHISIKF